MHMHRLRLSLVLCFPLKRQLVSWYFEPSQPQRVTSWLKTMFNPSPFYSTRKSSNHKLSINHKISPDTNQHKIYLKKKHKKTHTHKHQTQNFQRISPFGIAPVKKSTLGQDMLVSWTIPSIYQYQIFKKYKKGMDRSNKKF